MLNLEYENAEFKEAEKKINIKLSQFCKDLTYLISVVLTSTLSNCVELAGYAITYSFVLQIPNQAFNITIINVAIQICSLCKLFLSF